jgi:hypothetical protein
MELRSTGKAGSTSVTKTCHSVSSSDPRAELQAGVVGGAEAELEVAELHEG